ncbi:MAG: SDR family NAD(P)-dependent oxidoreductase [Opitutales bacterium]
MNRFSVIIVTGGSSGIGCSMIKAILRVSPEAHICNLSRSKPEIFLGENGLHLATDLTDPKALNQAVETVIQGIEDSARGEILLINNSGFGDYGPSQDAELSKQLNMIDLNIRAVVDLTARLMPEMRVRGGVVMNIASTAAFQPTPYLALYGASKAFVLNWSLALNEDLRGSKVRAMAVCPGPTRTNFFKRAGFETPPMQHGGLNGALDMSADEVAEKALIGLARNKSLLVIGWKNKCIAFFGSKTPPVWVARMGRIILAKLRLEQHRRK